MSTSTQSGDIAFGTRAGFINESRDYLVDAFEDLESVHQAVKSGAKVRAAEFEPVYRLFFATSGLASLVELDVLSQVSRVGRDIAFMIMNEELEASPENVRALVDVLEVVFAVFERVELEQTDANCGILLTHLMAAKHRIFVQ